MGRAKDEGWPPSSATDLCRHWSSSRRPSTCCRQRRRHSWALTSRRFTPARLPSDAVPIPLSTPPQLSTRAFCNLTCSLSSITTAAAQKSSTRKRRAAGSSADPGDAFAIPVTSASVSAPPGVRRSRSVALPDGASELEVQVGPGSGEASGVALLGSLAEAPLSALLSSVGFSSKVVGLDAPLSALLEEALRSPLSPFLAASSSSPWQSRRLPRFA